VDGGAEINRVGTAVDWVGVKVVRVVSATVESLPGCTVEEASSSPDPSGIKGAAVGDSDGDEVGIGVGDGDGDKVDDGDTVGDGDGDTVDD